MKIGIIGPSNLEGLKKLNKNCEKIINEISKCVVNHEIYLVPDKGSVSELFGNKYLGNGGENIFCLIPLQDKEFGFSWVNQDLGKKVSCKTWRNQPENLNERTEAMICLGYSAGGLAEIAYSKWFHKKPIYIIKELISQKLPKELEKSLDLKYVSYKKLKLDRKRI